MVKKKITKNTKKQIKNKNINIKIHIDQSKKTTGSNAKKSNIKTLPAYSAAPSSGGNYIRQFTQDPYYSQSQNEYEQLLLKYNNLVKKNNPTYHVLDSEKNKNRNYPQITNDFTDKNQNGQQLVKANKYKTNDDESVIENYIDYATYDDPSTNAEPENMLVRRHFFEQLPYNDLNTKDELLEYDKTPNLLKIEDDKLTTPQDEYINGRKVITNNFKELKKGKLFNIVSGLWVSPKNDEYKLSVKNKSDHLYYTTDLNEINKKIQEVREGHKDYNQNWGRYNEVKKRAGRKPKIKVQEKEDSDNDPEEIFINASPPPPVDVKIKTRSKTAALDPKVKINKSTLKKVKIGKN